MYITAKRPNLSGYNKEWEGCNVKIVLINLQNSMFAEGIERCLYDDGDFRIINIARADDVMHQSELTRPDVVFLEVTRYSPWTFSERMNIRDFLKKNLPDCKTVLMVNENADMDIAELVKQAKINGSIDGFVFSSVTVTYLSAYLQTV